LQGKRGCDYLKGGKGTVKGHFARSGLSCSLGEDEKTWAAAWLRGGGGRGELEKGAVKKKGHMKRAVNSGPWGDSQASFCGKTEERGRRGKSSGGNVEGGKEKGGETV